MSPSWGRRYRVYKYLPRFSRMAVSVTTFYNDFLAKEYMLYQNLCTDTD